MKCSKCLNEFEEKKIHESHDVPCYLFYNEIGRNNKKNKADKYHRRWLCLDCHNQYESTLNALLISLASQFGEDYFNKKGEKKDDSNTN